MSYIYDETIKNYMVLNSEGLFFGSFILYDVCDVIIGVLKLLLGGTDDLQKFFNIYYGQFCYLKYLAISLNSLLNVYKQHSLKILQ